MAETKPVQSLLRALDLLQMLADSEEEMRLQTLAERMGLKVPTVHNILKTLCSRGMVEKFQGGTYMVGPAMLEVADKVYNSRLLKEAAELCLEFGALPERPFVNFSTVGRRQIAVRLRVSPEQPRIIERPAGRTNSLYASASGLVVLAMGDEDQVLSLIEEYPFEEYGLPFWKSRGNLDKALEETRRTGVAVFPWEDSMLYKAAVYISGRGRANVFGYAIPVSRLGDESRREELCGKLLESAKRMEYE